MTASADSHDKLWKLIKDIRFGMFTHRHSDGALHSHPLTTQNKTLAADGKLFFFVSRKSEIAQRVKADGSVNVAYADPGADSYVSVTGTARDSEDKAKIAELWNKAAEAWFPGGQNDPDLQLLEVQIHEAEYWDVTDSKMTQLFKMAKAAVTGKPPTNLGEHREVKVSA